MRLRAPLIAGLIACACALPAAAAAEPDVERALAFLVKQQAPNGHFGKTNQLAITAMCGLAFLASGTTPTEGPRAEPLRRAIQFILEQQDERGAFRHSSSGYSAIHNHGYALTLLAECYGMSELDATENARLRRAILLGIRVTVASQADNGGFSYFLYNDPTTSSATDMWRDDEASTTVSQVQALRAARNAGFAVPHDAIARAVAYIARCRHEPTGGFIYSLAGHKVSVDGGDPSFAITAASLCALQALGRYRDGPVDRGIAYLRQFQPPRGQADFYYYGHYYAAQVMFLRGGPEGAAWLSAVTDELARKQDARDGAWRNGHTTLSAEDDAVLCTAWAVQVATITRGCLPLFAD